MLNSTSIVLQQQMLTTTTDVKFFMKMITDILFSIAESLLFDCLSWQCFFSLVKANLKIV